MTMSDADRADATKRLCQKIYVELGATANCNVTDVRAAINALDNVFDSQCNSHTPTDTIEVAFNKALPEPFKSNATVAQKSFALAYTIMKRCGVF